MTRFKKKLNIYKFQERVPCPFCSEDFPSNLSLVRHGLSKHNWNQDFLKGFDIIETIGSVMIVQKKESQEN